MASDGKIVIDVILDDGTVAKGVANIDKKLGGVAGAGRRAATGIKEIVTALGLVAAASKALDMMKTSLDGAIARYDTLNNFPVVMERMGFSTDVARQSIEKLSDGIQGLPTTLDGIVANTQRIALLTGDLDSATDTALALNNAFLASGSSAVDAERGLTQYVQMLSKGKVDITSWQTLQETMGYALRETAEAFGFAGESAQNDLYEALKDGTITFTEFNSKLIELSNATGGFAEIAKEGTSGIGTSFTNMKTDVVKGVTEIIAAIDSVLANTPLQSISNIIDGIGDTFFEVLTSIAGLISTTAEPLQGFFSIFENGAATLMTAFSEGGINGLIQAFIGLVPQFAEVGMQIVQNLVQGFNDNVQTFVDTALIAVESWLGNIGTIYPQLLTVATEMAVTLSDGLLESLPDLAKTALEVVTTIIKAIISSLPSLLESGIKILQSIVNGIINTLPELVEGVAQLIDTAVDTILRMLPEIVMMGVELVVSLIHGILDALPNIIDTIINLLDSLITTILDNLPLFIDAAIEIILALVDGLVNAVPKILTALLTILTKLIELIIGNLPKFIGAAISIALALIEGLVKATPQIIKAVFELVGKMAIEVVNFDWKGVGEDIVQGLINGLKGMAKNAWEAAKSLGATIFNGIKSFLKIASPSKVMIELGRWTGLGLAKGVEGTKKDNEKAVKEVGQVIINATNETQREISKIEANAEKERAKVREEYAYKRKTLKKATSQNIEKLAREEQKKITKINEKALSDTLKLQAKADSEKLSAIEKFIKQKRGLEQLSLMDEVRVWEESLKYFKDGTDEKIEAQIAYKDALKAVNDEIIKINQDYSNKISEVLETHKKKEQELTETYTKAVEDRTKALTNFASLFDEFDYKTTKSGTKLLKNLESQVEGFKKWQEEIEKLSQRAIDDGLLEELRQMGPKALPEIMALNKLTDEELSKYSDLYREKSELARQQAVKELEVMRADTQKQIFALHVQTATQLTQLQAEWRNKTKEIRTGTNKELGEMKSDLKIIGEQSIQGMIKGLEAMEPALMRKARSIANAVKREIERALDIRSPSRYMRDFIGKNMGLGWIEGIDSMEGNILKKANQMAEWMKPNIPKGFVNPLRGVGAPLGNIFPGNVSNVSNSSTSVKNDHSKHINVQVQGGSDSRAIARQVEKVERRLLFQMG